MLGIFEESLGVRWHGLTLSLFVDQLSLREFSCALVEAFLHWQLCVHFLVQCSIAHLKICYTFFNFVSDQFLVDYELVRAQLKHRLEEIKPVMITNLRQCLSRLERLFIIPTCTNKA